MTPSVDVFPPLEEKIGDCEELVLTVDNVFLWLSQARRRGHRQLEHQCWRLIERRTAEALSTTSFRDIDHDTLVALVNQDTLRINEARLFEALVTWSEAECLRLNLPYTAANKRSVLGRAVSLTRFTLMTVEEFALGPAQSGLLEDREVVSLFLYFIVNVPPSASCSLDVPRYCTCNRFRQVNRRWGYRGDTDRIRFVVDQKIFVVGFGLYGSLEDHVDYQVHLQVQHADSGEVLGANTVTLRSDGSRSTFRALFKRPIEVRPHIVFTAAAQLKGPDSFYGTEGIRKLMVECPKDRNVTFQFSCVEGENNFTSVSIGQIPEILFYMANT